MAMPQTAVQENRCIATWDNDGGRSRQLFIIEHAPEFHLPQPERNEPLDARSLAANRSHSLRSLDLGDYVHAAATCTVYAFYFRHAFTLSADTTSFMSAHISSARLQKNSCAFPSDSPLASALTISLLMK